MVAQWPSGRASDLQSEGRSFESRWQPWASCSHPIASAWSLQHDEFEPVSRGDNGIGLHCRHTAGVVDTTIDECQQHVPMVVFYQ